MMIKILVGGSGITRGDFLSSRQDLNSGKVDTNMCALDKCPDCKPEMIFETASEMPVGKDKPDNIGVGALVGAFATGVLIACVIARRRSKSEHTQRQIVASLSNDNDLELSDLDSNYSDKADGAQFT